MSIFGGSRPSLPPVQQAPTREDPAVAEAARKQRLAIQLQRGRQSTLLTGGQGVQGPANLQFKTLLGQ